MLADVPFIIPAVASSFIASSAQAWFARSVKRRAPSSVPALSVFPPGSPLSPSLSV